jgi:hypothetical protein
MKHQHDSPAVRPVIAGLLCITTFVFGYSLSVRSTSYSTIAPTSYIAAERTLGASSYLMRAGLAERCSQQDIERQVELFKAAAGGLSSRCVDSRWLQRKYNCSSILC